MITQTMNYATYLGLCAYQESDTGLCAKNVGRSEASILQETTNSGKLVKCLWCEKKGIDSNMTKQRESVGMNTGDDYYFCPLCHAHSPHIHTVNGAWDEAAVACYLAATPPNLPLTLYEAHKYGVEHPDEPLYLEYLGGNPYLTIGYVAAIYMTMFEPAGQGSASYGETWRAWLRKPTAADIAAAQTAREGCQP